MAYLNVLLHMLRDTHDNNSARILLEYLFDWYPVLNNTILF